MKIHGIAVGSVPFSNTLRLRYEQGGRRGMVQVVDGRQMHTCFNLVPWAAGRDAIVSRWRRNARCLTCSDSTCPRALRFCV
jgi:hypothetical protein